jgi:hypothetical protein
MNPGDPSKLRINQGDKLLQSRLVPAVPRNQQLTDITWSLSRHPGRDYSNTTRCGRPFRAENFSSGDDSFTTPFPVLRENAAQIDAADESDERGQPDVD